MSERSLITVTGAGGSGKTNLSRRLQIALDRSEDLHPYTIDHVSIGEYVREQAEQVIGHEVILSCFRQDIIDHLNTAPLQPMKEDLIVGILTEIILRSDADTLLLDGYPRYGHQVEQLYETSIEAGAFTHAAIITHVSDEEAVRRMLKRDGERTIDKEAALERLRQQKAGMQAVRSVFIETNLPFALIDTALPRERTLFEAATFIATALGINPRISQAS